MTTTVEDFLGWRVLVDDAALGPDIDAWPGMDPAMRAIRGLPFEPEKDSLGYVFETRREAEYVRWQVFVAAENREHGDLLP